MQLSFDVPRLMNDIIIQLNIEMDIVAKILIDLMKVELANLRINPYNENMDSWVSDVNNSLRFRAIASTGQLVREVGILDQNDMGLMAKALSIEFGTGQLMNSADNPWFGEFISSEYYHNSRQGTMIYSLPGEDVFDPESGTWSPSKATSRTPMSFMAQDGAMYWSTVFGNSSIMAQTYFDKGIDNAIERIDFSKYLIMK